MDTHLDWITIQTQQPIKKIQLGMMNLKVSVEHLCGLTKRMPALPTVSLEQKHM